MEPQYPSALEFHRASSARLRPEDKNHLGKHILNTFRTYPDRINQIDADTGVRETNASVLSRVIRVARAMKTFGLAVGDLVVVMGPNDLDICVPLYACFLLGVAAMPVDKLLAEGEMTALLTRAKPRMVFCQVCNLAQLERTRANLGFQIVTFDGPGDKLLSLKQFLEKYKSDEPEELFQAADYVPEETVALVVCTSGSTGPPRGVTLNYSSLNMEVYACWLKSFNAFPHKDVKILIATPLHWFSCQFFYVLSAAFSVVRLQAGDRDIGQATHVINKHKPAICALAPSMAAELLNLKASCDLSCFHKIYITGSRVGEDLVRQLNEAVGRPAAQGGYGLTEAGGAVLAPPAPPAPPPPAAGPGFLGAPLPFARCRLRDAGGREPRAGEVGELWFHSLLMCKGYYNSPEESERARSADGFHRTGDLMRREGDSYWFVERVQNIFKYMDQQIWPSEIEAVVEAVPGVRSAAVAGAPRERDGALPVAFVVAEDSSALTARRVKDAVKSKLSDAKQLRGGVVFLSALPMTSTRKVDQIKLNEMARTMKGE